VQRRCPCHEDRSRCYFNCDSSEHRASVCRSRPHCPSCAERGKKSSHRPGGPGCVPVRPVPSDRMERIGLPSAHALAVDDRNESGEGTEGATGVNARDSLADTVVMPERGGVGDASLGSSPRSICRPARRPASWRRVRCLHEQLPRREPHPDLSRRETPHPITRWMTLWTWGK